MEKVDITVILDRSGSMESIKSDMEGGFNAFIREQKEVEGELTVSLYQFDDSGWGKHDPVEEVYVGLNIKDVPPLTLTPRNGTALLDSVFRVVTATSDRLKGTEPDRPTKVIIVIITDGLENSSHEVKRADVNKLIEEKREKWNWEFVFLGANQDAFAEAGGMGIASGSSMNYKGTGESVNLMYSGLSAAVTRTRTGEETDSGQFFEEDEQNV